jgi:hypothetical protein
LLPATTDELLELLDEDATDELITDDLDDEDTATEEDATTDEATLDLELELTPAAGLQTSKSHNE